MIGVILLINSGNLFQQTILRIINSYILKVNLINPEGSLIALIDSKMNDKLERIAFIEVNVNYINNGLKTIERNYTPLGQRVAQSLWSLLRSWSSVCIYCIILSWISITLVLFLKLIIVMDMQTFMVNDNWFYLAYYLALNIYSSSLPYLTEFSLISYGSHFWKWMRKTGATFLYIEFHGFSNFLIHVKNILWEVEHNAEAALIVLSLFIVSGIRLVLITFGYLTGMWKLNELMVKRKLSRLHYGRTSTDISDAAVFHLTLYCLNLNEFNTKSIVFSMIALCLCKTCTLVSNDLDFV